MTTSLTRAAAVCALLAGTSLSATAWAQNTPPPAFQNVDENGVDLTTGAFNFSILEGSIGDTNGGVSLTRTWAGPSGWVNNWGGGVYNTTEGGVSVTKVELGPISDTFSVVSGAYVSKKKNGATLVNLANGYLRYTANDGTQIDYLYAFQDGPNGAYRLRGSACRPDNAVGCSIPVTVRRPDGMTFSLNWDFYDRCNNFNTGGECSVGTSFYRFRGVTSSANYKFTVNYSTNEPGAGTTPAANWLRRTGVQFTNLASTPSSVPTVSYAYPSSDVVEVTDTGNRTWRLTTTSGNLTGIRRPGASSNTTTVSYGANGVSSVTRDGVTTNYVRSVSGSTGTVTVTNALMQTTTVVSDLTKGRPTSVTNALSQPTSFTYDSDARLKRTTYPQGNFVELSYDDRGNVTQVLQRDKIGNTANDIITSASFDSTCAYVVKCNKPNSTTDARGNTTNYVYYDTTHGGLLSVTQPEPTPSQNRPQTRYAYTQVTAVTGQPVYMLTGVSACQTTASCTGGADEAKQSFAYNSTNLLLESATAGNGTGTLAATQAITYDSIGNLLTVNGPLSGAADITTYRYNAARQLVGTISPDPDGASALKRRAVKTNYGSTDGLPTSTEVGTVNGTSDGDWAAFVSLQQSTLSYDPNARPNKSVMTAGGTTYQVTQFGYDELGRPQCTALRMNPTEWSSLPASACTLDTAGAFGADRITKIGYDAVGRANKTTAALGAGAGIEADEATATFTSNGQLETLTDARGNTTTYEYDAHDRLSKTRYPVTTAGAGTSSATDYEEFLYDPNGNVTTQRLRGYAADNTQYVGITYDTLNRPTRKDLPGTNLDTDFSYDLLSRPTRIDRASDGVYNVFSHDALSRLTSNIQSFGTQAYQYDLAGRRTRVTWQDGFYVDYDYLLTGETSAVRENGATSGVGVLATYGYDDLGRRTSLLRGNGMATTYGYDNASRLTSQSQDASGTSYDVTNWFGYSPANQITSSVRSNNNYKWTGAANLARSYATNGLNQHTQEGGTSLGYDARGNLTSRGSTSYTYSPENQLTSTSGGTTLYYDTLGLLHEYDTTVSRRFMYDGVEMAGEIANPSGAVLRRYVRGPGADEVLVWYEGSGTSDRRFLHADERGSIVLVTSSTGAALAINSYDEYGNPASTNVGRFQYTGQAWLPEIGMYYYKARMYAPSLGRFMQTDPIGYGAGMNLYAYVGNDPANYVDPLGLEANSGDTPIGPRPICDSKFLICPTGYPDRLGFDFDTLPDPQVGAPPPGSEAMRDNGEIVSTGRRLPGKPQNDKPCPGPLRRPSTAMMNEATNKALASVPGGGKASSLTSEFSKISKLPNFSSGGWRAVGSTHSESAYEHDLGNSGKAVKVYIGDRNFGGANTVTITDPTNSIGHYAAFPAFMIGMPVNARNAAVYLSHGEC